MEWMNFNQFLTKSVVIFPYPGTGISGWRIFLALGLGATSI